MKTEVQQPTDAQTEKEFFRNQITDLAKDKEELLNALKESNQLIQECADYYQKTGLVDNLKESVIRIALRNQSIILKHKI